MRHSRTRHDLRCGCSARIKLAEYGCDEEGRAYLHIRAFKGRRVITNTVHRGGEHELLCNSCHRVTRIYLTPRGSKVLPPSRNLSELLKTSESITLPQAVPDK